jgi:predicted methyltransferase
MRKITMLALACLAFSGVAQAADAPSPKVAAALAAPLRPETDKAQDANRRGGAILEFINIKPGWKVGDLMQGSGYFTRLFAASVGPKGHIYSWSPPEFIDIKKALYGDSLDVLSHDYPGLLTPMRMKVEDLTFPEPLDMIFTSQNYHDLHVQRFFPVERATTINAIAFKALKHGGAYVIVDHVAQTGDVGAPDRVHRIDPAILRKEVESAGFKFDGESSALRNPADDHSVGVMNQAIRGHTDQIIYRFRKP